MVNNLKINFVNHQLAGIYTVSTKTKPNINIYKITNIHIKYTNWTATTFWIFSWQSSSAHVLRAVSQSNFCMFSLSSHCITFTSHIILHTNLYMNCDTMATRALMSYLYLCQHEPRVLCARGWFCDPGSLYIGPLGWCVLPDLHIPSTLTASAEWSQDRATGRVLEHQNLGT